MTPENKRLRPKASGEHELRNIWQSAYGTMEREEVKKAPTLEELYEESIKIRGMIDRPAPVEKLPSDIMIMCKCV